MPTLSARIPFLFVCCLVLCNNARCEEPNSDKGPAKPNIVLIMADDMGYTDIGCYGSEIETPVLDGLAQNGVRFTQFYNTSRCCPTRAALLTGLYSHQAGIGLMTGDRGYDAYRGDLNRRCVTIAEALQSAGYRNYMSGKWHVTRHTGPKADNSNWPLQRGFDRFYGTITGAGSFFDPATLCRGNTYITPENDPEYQPESFYYTDAISDNAARFVQQHMQKQSDQPFFMYVSYTSAHWPMHAPAKDIAKYEGMYDNGYTPIRTARHAKAIKEGVLSKQWDLSTPDTNWDKFPHKAWDIRCMEVYAAMVDCMDQGIGRIINQLKQTGAFDNTIVLYLQDNGGCAEGYGRANNSHKKNDFNFKPLGKDGLQTKIWPPMQTRDGRWVGTGPETMPGGEDTFVAYGQGWANVSNTPFRGYKHDSYEGGISTPLIVHWPEGILPDQRGHIVNDPSHLIDLMPTFVEAAGASYPKSFAGETIQPMEGVSLLPALKGKALVREAPLCFEHHGNLALRDGRWKIVSAYKQHLPTTWELYDMQSDRTELQDLSAKHPERLKTMIEKWQAWADRVGVQPWPFTNKKRSPTPRDTKPSPPDYWKQANVKRFAADFNKSHDFLANGMSQTNWSGFVGKGTDQTADRIQASDGKLYLKSKRGRYQEPWRPLGPLLYKEVAGDFRATVRVEDYESLSFNNCGIMARVGDLDLAGPGEDWISIDYFPIYGGIYARTADDGRRREPSSNGQGRGADKYLQLERVGNRFYLRHSRDGKSWKQLDCSPIQRSDLASVPLQVGLFQATYSDNVGEVSFDDFLLEELPPATTARVVQPADGQTLLPSKLKLEWIPGAGAAFHDLYVGTSASAVATASPESKEIYRGRIAGEVTSLDLDSLPGATTFYWRVDEGGAGQLQRGKVWKFTTYDRILADFESLASKRDNIWIVRGKKSEPPISTEDPHSGKRSLKLHSSESKTQATLTFLENQDWHDSAFNFRSLRLHFRGEANNKLQKLYVSLEDNDWKANRATVEYDLNAAALSNPQWSRWDIDLHDFVRNNPSLRLNSIKKLSIGIVGNGNLAVDDLTIEEASSESKPLVQRARNVQSVPFHKVQVTGGLWRERMDVNRKVSLPHVWSRCETSVKGNGQPSKRLENFQKAAGLIDGPFTGTYFNDSDVYKILEGTANSLRNHPNNDLEAYADKVIDWIAKAQWDDGYLFTFYSIPEKQKPRRWQNIGGQHELYCAGHLIEAGIAYREATGKRKLFDVAVRFADLICETFQPGKIESAPGHQEIELALIKLARVTGKSKYKRTAEFFIDQRGNETKRRLYGTYSQDHIPFVQQEKAVGHSVRATYLFSAATDIAQLDNNEAYANALLRLWDNIVNTKTYLTGGIGQPGGPEGFAGDYQLANGCYAETCSGIGFAMWNHRLHQMTGESKYHDLIERTFLNNMLGSLSAKGDRHYYTNPLVAGGRERWEWPGHDCACCPSNLVRVISSIGGYAYSVRDASLFVNHYIASTAEVEIAGQTVTLKQETNYPWDGDIAIKVSPQKAAALEIKLRIPGWARNQPMPGNLYRYAAKSNERIQLSINGTRANANITEGYISIKRNWQQGDTIRLSLPMPVRRVIAHPKATADKGLVAIERGPIVYCAEFKDNALPVGEIAIGDDMQFDSKAEDDFFGGAVTLSSGKLKLIPYYLYANRGPGWMRVWMPRTE